MVIEVITSRDRAAWLRVRGRDITASVVGALFNEHEFTSLFELCALKSGRLQRDDDENPAMRRGRLLEPVAVQILREERPDWTITHNAAENVYYRDPEHRLGATPDVIAVAPGRGRGVVQIKSVEASTFKRKWHDDDGVVEPPLWISLQAMLEAHLTGAQWAAVMPLVIGHGIDAPLIEVPLDHLDGVVEAIREKAAEFWQMVEEGREPPVDYGRDGATIDRLYRFGDAFEEIDLTADDDIDLLCAQAAAHKQAIAREEAALAKAEAAIKHKMGTAELAHLRGGRKLTWRTHKRAGGVVYRVLRLPRD